MPPSISSSQRAKRIAADKEAEEQRIVARMAVKAAENSLHNAHTDSELAPSFEATDIPLELASEDDTSEVFPTLESSQV
jgi:hypothetical protein